MRGSSRITYCYDSVYIYEKIVDYHYYSNLKEYKIKISKIALEKGQQYLNDKYGENNFVIKDCIVNEGHLRINNTADFIPTGIVTLTTDKGNIYMKFEISSKYLSDLSSIFEIENILYITDSFQTEDIKKDIETEFLIKSNIGMEYVIERLNIYAKDINEGTVNMALDLNGGKLPKDYYYDGDIKTFLKTNPIDIFLRIHFKAKNKLNEEIIDNLEAEIDKIAQCIIDNSKGDVGIRIYVHNPEDFSDESIDNITSDIERRMWYYKDNRFITEGYFYKYYSNIKES